MDFVQREIFRLENAQTYFGDDSVLYSKENQKVLFPLDKVT